MRAPTVTEEILFQRSIGSTSSPVAVPWYPKGGLCSLTTGQCYTEGTHTPDKSYRVLVREIGVRLNSTLTILVFKISGSEWS